MTRPMTLDEITAAAQARIREAASHCPVCDVPINPQSDDLCKHVDCDLLSDCLEPLANQADETMPYCPFHYGEAVADMVAELDHDCWNES